MPRDSLGASGRRNSRLMVAEELMVPDDEEERVILDTLEKRFEGADEEFLDCLREILEKRVFTQDEAGCMHHISIVLSM